MVFKRLKHIDAFDLPPLHLLIRETLKHHPSGAHRDAHLERPTGVWKDDSRRSGHVGGKPS